ncbi:MAG: glycosyltransferase family 4 protein [Acidobacteria bacterium]|nr:glycosyltransferase family 4 protein [Acidobacteriota bacterium]
MKILAILTYYHPHWTGLTRHAQSVAEGLAARGHSVSVLAVQHLAELAREELIQGVRVFRAPVIGGFSRGMISPSFLGIALRLIREHDVTQIHTPLPEAPAVAALCRLRRRPLLMTHHGDIVLPAGIANRFLSAAAFGLLSLAGGMATRVTSYSLDYARHSRLLRPFESKLRPIPPPVQIPLPSPEGVEKLRAQLGLDGRRIIGVAGRWVEEKGFDILLEALPLLLRTNPDAHVVFAGESPHYERFLDRCRPAIERSGRVTLLGLVRERQQMADFFRLCDVFALPSRSDMFALVQAEAMLCGTPVVASDIPGARVVVRDTGMGVLVEPCNPAALAAGLRTVLDDPARYRRDPEVIRHAFDPARSLDLYESLLREMTGS